MPLFIFQIIYSVIFLFALISGLFVVYHIVKYSYDKTATLLMLLVFCSGFLIMISANLVLFSGISAEDIELLLNF